MNASSLSTEIEPRWRTYSKAAAFTLPAMIVWTFSLLFLLPKLQEVWNQAGFAAPVALTAMNVSRYIQHNLLILAIPVCAILLMLEWRSTAWRRYRVKLVWTTAFVVNTVVLVFITVMFTTAIVSAAALLHVR